MFKRLFGGGNDDAPSSRPVKKSDKAAAEAKTMTALEALKAQEVTCDKKIEYLQSLIDKHTAQVKELLQQQQKTKALAVLKRKKMYEKQLQAVQTNSERIYEQIMQLEMSKHNIDTVEALKQAAQAGKANLVANDLENVEEVLEDIAEQNDQMAAMQDALAQPTGLMAGLDDDELAAELDEIQNMQLDDELTQAPVPTKKVPQAARPQALDNLPAAPTKPVQTEEELELEALQREMELA